MTEVFVHGLQFFGFHGVHDYERTNGNDFIVDVNVTCEESASTTDNVADTFDYSRISDIVEAVNTEASYKTLERLATRIGEETFVPIVSKVTVTLRKLNPPMPGELDSVGVRVTVASKS